VQRQQELRKRRCASCRAQYDAGWASSSLDAQTLSKRAALLQYAETVEPSLIETFSEQVPATVLDASRTTVRGVLGTLPPQYFDVQISSRADSFKELLYTHLRAGYMFRNALFRMELRGALILPALPLGDIPGHEGEVAAPEVLDMWAPGSQLKCSGEVLRWHFQNGTQAVPVAQYIQDLEAENRGLKQEMASVRLGTFNQNELLEYIQSLGPDAELLTANASRDVLDAMTSFVERCTGSNEHADLAATTEYNVQELAPQLFWTIAVGYMLRSLEVRYDMKSSLDEGDIPELLP
jgi:hypothetical protein